MPRVRIEEENDIIEPKLPMINSGSTLLNRVLGGGWAEGRVANIVGDRSTGKTLICIEACANFVAKYPKGKIKYRETEAAFDTTYAESLGLPMANIDFGEDEVVDTVEQFFDDLTKFAASLKSKDHGLYILDSLDALSDDAEMSRDMTKGSFGASKAKKMSELFRKSIRNLRNKNVTVLIVSQLRDKIGVTFGETQTRSGGRALDFYASQVIWLANLGQIKKTKEGVERSIGVRVRARCKKNKVGLPFRECEFPIKFLFGIDDVASCVEWLSEVKHLHLIGINDNEKAMTSYVRSLAKMDEDEYKQATEKLQQACGKLWVDIDKKFMPTRKKY